MKWMVVIVFLLATLRPAAQEGPSYTDLLQTAEELVLTDSVLIDASQTPRNLLDSMMVKTWLSSLLPSTPNNRLKRRNYYLTAKVTSHQKFDLLLVQEEKKEKDSTDAEVLYLVSLKKDGTFIASLEASITGAKRNSVYNTRSWLYPGYQVQLLSHMTVNKKSYEDQLRYTINNGGRFILAPKY